MLDHHKVKRGLDLSLLSLGPKQRAQLESILGNMRVIGDSKASPFAP